MNNSQRDPLPANSIIYLTSAALAPGRLHLSLAKCRLKAASKRRFHVKIESYQIFPL
jgi:hypothetical protein